MADPEAGAAKGGEACDVEAVLNSYGDPVERTLRRVVELSENLVRFKMNEGVDGGSRLINFVDVGLSDLARGSLFASNQARNLLDGQSIETRHYSLE